MNRAVFLDRDGTIIEDRHYLADPDGVSLLDGVAAALAGFRARGFRLVVVSNQSGVARGLISREAHERVAARTVEVVARAGIALDGAYYCFHGPDDGCDCRKPKPGLLQRAARDLDIDLTASLVIGDKTSDTRAGRAVGCFTALLGDAPDASADVVAPNWTMLCETLSTRFR
jgi:D-glycero-D-manno-heptose 1,7-bisphosphate phosphatase